MVKIIFCKYNFNRSPEFQTKTTIYRDEDNTYIEKYALSGMAQGHMDAFERNYVLTKDLYKKISFLMPEKTENGVRYPYICGTPVEELLNKDIVSFQELLTKLKEILERLYEVNEDYRQSFVMTEDFRRIFGEVDCAEDICISPCNVDMILDNLILKQGQVIAYDYEWVYAFPIPEKYVIYRVLCRFYDKHLHYMEKQITLDMFMGYFGFSDSEQKRYRKMEDSFIRYIYGKTDPVVQNLTYRYPRTTLKQIQDLQKQLDQAIKDYNQVIDVLHKTEKEYLLTIERLDNAANRLNDAVQQKQRADCIIRENELEIKRKETAIHELEEYWGQRYNQLQVLHESVAESKSWKLTRPLRWITKGSRCIKEEGILGFLKFIKKKIQTKKELSVSPNSIKQELESIKVTNAELLSLIEVSEEELQYQKSISHRKKISIICPLFNTPEIFLTEMLESVKRQTYSNWELCLVNFSTDQFEIVDMICCRYAQEDSRILYYRANENGGISENTNYCIQYATGEYIALLDHDDILHPSALFKVAQEIERKNADFIYTDEVKFEDTIDNVFQPNFKPDFSADELRAHNYICHFNVYSRKLYDQVGGYRKEFDGSQDHDMVLRLTEVAREIVHVPDILYYWRVHSNSVAKNIDAKSYATDAGAEAVTQQLMRMGERQYAESVINHIPVYRLRLALPQKSDLAVVIWGTEEEQEIEKCRLSLKGIEKDNTYVTKGKEDTLGAQLNCWMKQIEAKYVLFLYGKLQIDTDNFLDEIMLYWDRNDVATIDAKVLTDCETIFSGGCYLSGESNEPIKLRCSGKRKDYAGYENGMIHTRDVVASTGLCTVVSRKYWEQCGGFTDTDQWNHVLEYSYRAWKNGGHNLWTPFLVATGMNHTDQIKFIHDLKDLDGSGYEDTDPYFSRHITQMCLE